MKNQSNSAVQQHFYYFKEICVSSVIFKIEEENILLKGLFQFDDLHFQSYLAMDYKLFNQLLRLSVNKKLVEDINDKISEFLSTQVLNNHIIEINLKNSFKNFLKLQELYLYTDSKKMPSEAICNVSNYLHVIKAIQVNQ